MRLTGGPSQSKAQWRAESRVSQYSTIRATITDFMAAQRRNIMPAPAHWRLAGGGTTVFYDTTGPGVLHYVHPPMNLIFNGPQIRLVHVADLGTLASVTLS